MEPFEPNEPPMAPPPAPRVPETPRAPAVPTRAPELDVGDLVRTTFRVIGANALSFFGVPFLFQLLPSAISLAASAKMNRAMQALGQEPPPGGDVGAAMTQAFGPILSALPYFGLAMVAHAVLLPLAFTFVIRGALDTLEDRPFTVPAGIQAIATRGWLLVVAQLLVGLVVFGATFVGLFLCILPGIAAAVFLGLSFLCVHPALLAEDIGPVDAMRRSWDLVEGQRVQVFLLMLLLFAVYMVLACGTGAVGGILGGLAAVSDPANAQRIATDPTSPVQLVAAFLNALVMVFWNTCIQVASAVVYARLVGLRGELDAGTVAKVFQ